MESKFEVLRDKAKDEGIKVPVKEGDKVLYLGASHGVTAIILSEIVGNDGFVFCVDISRETMKTLLPLCETFSNMAPLLFDAAYPEKYKDCITEVDVIYQDIAQKNQVSILLDNADMFLKKGGYAILMLKTAAIDSLSPKETVLEIAREELWKTLKIKSVTDLEPEFSHHYCIICRK